MFGKKEGAVRERHSVLDFIHSLPAICVIEQILPPDGTGRERVYRIPVVHVPEDGCYFAKPTDQVEKNREFALYLKPEGDYSTVNANAFLLFRQLPFEGDDPGLDAARRQPGFYVKCADDVRRHPDSGTMVYVRYLPNGEVKYLNPLSEYGEDGTWRTCDPQEGTGGGDSLLKDGQMFCIGDQRFRFRLPEDVTSPVVSPETAAASRFAPISGGAPVMSPEIRRAPSAAGSPYAPGIRAPERTVIAGAPDRDRDGAVAFGGARERDEDGVIIAPAASRHKNEVPD